MAKIQKKKNIQICSLTSGPNLRILWGQKKCGNFFFRAKKKITTFFWEGGICCFFGHWFIVIKERQKVDHRGSAGLLGRENPQNSGGVEFGGWGICGEERGGRVDAKRWEKGGRSPPEERVLGFVGEEAGGNG